MTSKLTDLLKAISLFALCGLTATEWAFAQNTGGIFGPIVREDHRLFEYRIAHDPDRDATAQRIHYEQSLNGTWMLRGVVQGREVGSDFEFDYFQGELFWDFGREDSDWKTGLRFDFRVRDGNRPETFGVNWMNHWNLRDGLTARFVVLTAVDLGDNARDGVLLQTRASLYTRLARGRHLGLELYNSYGSTDHIPDFDDQRHQLGPVFRLAVGPKTSLRVDALFGLTDATADTEFRFWTTVRF